MVRRLGHNLLRVLQKVNHALPVIKHAVPLWMYKLTMRHLFANNREYSQRPHRKWIEEEMLPWLGAQNPGAVVFVGCAPYTWHYEHYFNRRDTRYITLDPLPAARVWGSRRHYIGVVQDLYLWLPSQSIDVLILIGVYGFGITSEAELGAALFSIHRVLKVGGLLVMSWNNDVSSDPATVHPDLMNMFEPVPTGDMPPRKTFDSTLVLDFYRARHFQRESGR